MRKILILIILFISCVMLSPGLLFAESSDEASAQVSQPDPQGFEEQVAPYEAADETDDLSDYYEPDDFEDEYNSDESHLIISDPLEPVNRAIFFFNDRLYFWFLRPVATGYSAVAPAPVRKCIQNFFSNLGFPIRFVNCLLQAKFTGAGYEFERFFINSTLGLAGFIDMADREFGVKAVDEDFGQTLGLYGLGHGFYINLPLIGPSSALDTAGLAGDYFFEPLYHADIQTEYVFVVRGYEDINKTSLALGDYDVLKNSALDPYVAFRDAYIQYRNNKIKE